MKKSTRKSAFPAWRIWLAPLVALLLLALAPAQTSADSFAFGSRNDTRTFFAVLNAGQEVPPRASNSVGNALMDFNKRTKMLCYAISFTPLVGDETVAHFHGPASIGETASVRRDISVGGVPSPAGAPKTGCVGPLSRTEERELKNGLWYINIHSSEFGPGEIRGQVLPVDKPTVSSTP